MGYKCECGKDSGCDTCKYDYCGMESCLFGDCPLKAGLEYPYGVELCNYCGWEPKEV